MTIQRYIAVLGILCLFAVKGVAQAKRDTTSPEELAELIRVSGNSSFHAYYLADSFSKAGDTTNTEAELMKVSPYYFWYDTETTPANIDSFLSVRFVLNSSDRKKYVAKFIKAYNEPKPKCYDIFKKFHDEDQEIRSMSGIGKKYRNLPIAKAMYYSDNIHFAYLFQYVKQNGWPTLSQGSLYANVLAVHDHLHHRFYLPYIKQAFLKGDAPFAVYQLVSLWLYTDHENEKVLNELRIKEYVRIDVSRLIFDEDSKVHASQEYKNTVYRSIIDMTKKMCPVDYYFTDEQKEHPLFAPLPNFDEMREIQDVVIANNCYNGDSSVLERDRHRTHYKLTGEYNLYSDGPRKRYLYLVSNKPRKVRETIPGTSDTFRLFFEKDRYTLEILQQVRLQAIMIDSIGVKDSVGIVGYADITGRADANKILSQKRAENIRDYLQGNGMRKELFKECTGEGAILRDDDEKEYPKDRRVDIIVRHPVKLNSRPKRPSY